MSSLQQPKSTTVSKLKLPSTSTRTIVRPCQTAAAAASTSNSKSSTPVSLTPSTSLSKLPTSAASASNVNSAFGRVGTALSTAEKIKKLNNTIAIMNNNHIESDFYRSNSPELSGVLTENTDDFIIGDRIYVGGTKPGHIQYIGETQFAPGEWAGIVLDEPIGKNDGSVAGVRYFQCEPKRGVFSRLTKLTQYAIKLDGISSPISPSRTPSPSLRLNGSSAKPSQVRSATPTSNSQSPVEQKLCLGDRVQVISTSGTKIGTLRYMGVAEFAAGEWAGVELDEPVGKNDGSVAGKKYFECPNKFGLFAPIHKTFKVGTVTPARKPSTPSVTSTVPRRSVLASSTPKRAGSQESLSTISSASSIARANKVRLGITSLTGTGRPIRSSTTNALATNNALQVSVRH